jgi:hypothetical protein
MGAIEDTRKILQNFMAPELRGIQERLDSIDKRFETVERHFETVDKHFAALEHKMADDKAELLRTIDFMLRELSLRIELAAVKNRNAEATPAKAASIEHQQ